MKQRQRGFWPGRHRFLALVAGCLLVQAALAWAGAFSDCVEDVVAQDLDATVAFQRGLRDLALRDNPDFEALASLNMELQIALTVALARAGLGRNPGALLRERHRENRGHRREASTRRPLRNSFAASSVDKHTGDGSILGGGLDSA